MGLRLILGATGSGKSNKLVQEMISEAEKEVKQYGVASLNTKFFAIVPEQATLSMQRKVVDASRNDAVMNIDVVSFERLARVVFAELGINAENVLDDTGKALVLRKVLNEAQDELVVYKSKIRMSGFVEEIKSIVTELKQYDIDDEKLSVMQENARADKNLLLYNKLADIRFIYKRFNEEISERYTTSEEVLDIFAGAALKSEKLKNACIYLDGYTGFTPIQYKLIEKFLQTAKRVTVALTLPEDKIKNELQEYDIFNLSNKTYSKLIGIASKYPESLETVFVKRDEIVKKEEFIYKASSVKDEVVFTAKEILRLVRDENYRFRDIAVIASDIEEYYPVIKETFEEAEISCFIDYKRRINDNPLVRFIMAALQTVNENFSYDSIFSLLKTGLSGMTFDEASLLENYCLEFGIKGIGAWNGDFKKNKKIYGTDKYSWDLSEINQLRCRIMKPVGDFYNNARNCKNARQYSKAIKGFCEDCRLEEKIQELCKCFNDEGRLSLSKEYEQIYELVMALLDKTEALLGEEELSLKEYINILEQGFKEIKIGIIPPSIDAITAGDLTRTRLDNIRALFLIGVNDGKIPKSESGSGIFTEKERNFLKKDFEIAPGFIENHFIQKFYLYLILNKCKEKLYISYASINGAGEQQKASYVIDDLGELIDNCDLKEVRKPETEWPEHALRRLALEIRKTPDAKVLRYFANEAPYKLKQIIDGAFFSNAQTALDERTALDLYGDVLCGSVSRYEKFNECPFKHFIGYGLKIKKRPEYKIEASDLGSIYHDALEKYSHQLVDEGFTYKTVDDENSHRIIRECVKQVMDNQETDIMDSAARNEFLTNRINEIALKTTDVLRQHVANGNYDPAEFEYSFLRDITEKVKFAGKIDRIDLYESEDVFVKIIDYKSGNKEFKISDIYSGLQLQLIAYMKQALEETKRKTKKNVRPGGVYYYRINDKFIDEKNAEKQFKMSGLSLCDEENINALDVTIKDTKKSNIVSVAYGKEGTFAKGSIVANDIEFNSIMQYVDNSIINVSEQIMAGNVDIKPYYQDEKNNGCLYCDYKNICKFQPGSFGCDWKEKPGLTREEMEDVLYGRV